MWHLLPALITRHNENFCSCSSVLSFQACRTLDVELIWWSCRSTHGITWWSCCCLYVCRGLTRTRTLDDLCVCVLNTICVIIFFNLLCTFWFQVAGNFHFAPGKSFQQSHVHGKTCTRAPLSSWSFQTSDVHVQCVWPCVFCDCSIYLHVQPAFMHILISFFLRWGLLLLSYFWFASFFLFISPAWQTFLSSVHDIRAGS